MIRVLWAVAFGWVLLCPGGSQAKPDCEDGEIQLPAKSLLFNGPATGYALFAQSKEERCVRVMKESDPAGWFLILWDAQKNQLAWWPHPDALVRFNSDNEKRERAVLPETRYVIKKTTGHAAPNFGADVTHWVPIKEQVVVLEQVRPFVGVRAVLRARPVAKSVVLSHAPQHQFARRATRFQGGADSLVTTEPPAEQSDAGPRLSETQREKVTALVESQPATPRKSRRFEIESFTGAAWQEQRFITDSVNDPFARYVMETVASGLHVKGRYLHNESFLVEVGGGLQGSQLDIAAGAVSAEPAASSTPLLWLNANINAGLKVHQTQKAKVQALLGYALDYLWSPLIEDFGGVGPMPAVVNGMYHQLRPGIRVLLNSAKPEMGYLALEAALPVGIYQMYPDPLETYIAYVTTDEKYRLNPPAAVGEGLPEYDENGNATSTEVSNEQPLSRGFDGRFTYHWPVVAQWEILGA